MRQRKVASLAKLFPSLLVLLAALLTLAPLPA